MSFETRDVERKTLSILRVLHSLQKPAGARIIAQHLKDQGVILSEGTVRYHLRIMDERGLTKLVGQWDGRLLTERGMDEVKSALVKDKVGFAISRIELLALRTSFDSMARGGGIPVNVSLLAKESFTEALRAMKPVFEAGLGISDLVAVASEGEQLGDLTVPKGKMGLATVCSIVLNGTLLKAGVPMGSRFGGILQIRNHKPLRFVELISYAGCSLDPSEIFIRAKMTSVREVVRTGDGTILANFREIPAASRSIVTEKIARLREAGIGGVYALGNTSEPICQIAVGVNRVGMVLLGGLNPLGAAVESGIEVENIAESGLIEYSELQSFWEL